MDVDPAAREFAAAVSRSDGQIDLARAALIIAKSEYPTLDVEANLDRLEALARRARTSRAIGDPLGQLHRLRECLFEEEGFSGNSEDYADPRNSYLNDVLDRRLGIPITLSLVLIEVGRRLGLEMEGIGLPGHFITGARVDGEQVLLDPFNRGDHPDRGGLQRGRGARTRPAGRARSGALRAGDESPVSRPDAQ